MPDAPPDVCLSWNPGIPFEPCDILPGDRGGELILDQTGTYNYNTNDGTLSPPGGGTPIEHQFQELQIQGNAVHLVSAAAFRIEANAILRVQGSIPLLIASWSEIEIEGEIDASSEGGSSGANANPSDCGGSTGGNGGLERRRRRRRRWRRLRRSRRAGRLRRRRGGDRGHRGRRGESAISVCAAAAPAATVA